MLGNNSRIGLASVVVAAWSLGAATAAWAQPEEVLEKARAGMRDKFGI